MNAAAGAVTASLPVEDWMLAAFPSQIHAEAWELRGALDVLWDFFAQAIPKLKLDNDAYGIGLLRLNKIMPAVGEKFVDPADATKFRFQPAGQGGYEPRPPTKDAAIKDAALRFREANTAISVIR